MIVWAAFLRVNLAEETVLFATFGASLVSSSSEFGILQLLVIYVGFAASYRWTDVASKSGRVADMAFAAALMTVTACLTPLGTALGAAFFVLVQAARNVIKPVWGSISGVMAVT